MRRREFIKAIVYSAPAWPLAARAQQTTMPLLGFVHASSAARYATIVKAFQQGLGETGFNDGQNIKIEYRWADGHYDRLPEFVDDLIHRGVSVIVAAPLPAAIAAKNATGTIPIVFEHGGDPVRFGLVSSLNRPSGNVTGIVNQSNTLLAKRVELIHAVVPNARFIVVLLNPDNQNYQFQLDDLAAAQKLLGVEIQPVRLSTNGDLDAAFAKIMNLHPSALVIGPDPYLTSRSREIAVLAIHYAVPTSHELRDFVAAGGLMSYGADLADAYHLTGIYAGRILRGEKPGDLPVQQSTKVELCLNLKAAKQLGLTIPLSLLGRADEVIE